MHTLLSQFCQDFDAHLRPILEPLESTSRALSEAEQGLPGKELLPELYELEIQFRTLCDKVAEQQAFVLIFGPLKSGKSTLMNAVSAAYVSEVTTLPAYPCMVYVSHSDELKFIVTRYNGETQKFSDPTALRMEINRAHGELADRIRDVENKGEVFEPALHFPRAIRRVDVKVPAGELNHSGAVLVDTPGLYTRMKFGYDCMTRDFRNAAACAIFVVKSDNLFLEQVFSEFTRLLDLFSRIFLVVNLDSSKKDLKPDGSLEPSLEQSDPIRIIEAFQTLVMSAPLKEAVDEGRLRIYPVDLQQAASRRLRERNGELESDEAGEEVERYEGKANFNAFLGDLTDYLNSTEYLVAFLGDSLRRATSLLSETHSLFRRDSLAALKQKTENAEHDIRLMHARREALERLEGFSWEEAFHGLERDLQSVTREWAREVEERSAREFKRAVQLWFETDESVHDLIESRLMGVATQHREELAVKLHRALGDRVTRGAAGIAIPANVEEDLRTASIHLDDLGRSALTRLSPEIFGKKLSAPMQSSDIPVRRTLLDWLFFRSQAKLRQKLFGPAERPALRVPALVKGRRLGTPVMEAFEHILGEYQAEFFPATVRELCNRILGDYASAASKRVRGQLHGEGELLSARLADMEGRTQLLRDLLQRLDKLQGQVENAMGAIEVLQENYGQTEPVLLMQPYEPGRELVSKAGEIADQLLGAAAEDEPAEEATSEAVDPIELEIQAALAEEAAELDSLPEVTLQPQAAPEPVEHEQPEEASDGETIALDPIPAATSAADEEADSNAEPDKKP